MREVDPLGRETTWDYDAAGQPDRAHRRRGPQARVELRRLRPRLQRSAPTARRRSRSRATRSGARSRSPSRAGAARAHAGTAPAGWSSAAATGSRCATATTTTGGARSSATPTARAPTTATTPAACSTACSTRPPARSRSSATRRADHRARGVGRARWEYEDAQLVGYAGRQQHAAHPRRGGRIVAAAIDGSEQRFAYDAAGQLIAAGDRTFTYDAGGRLVARAHAVGAVDLRVRRGRPAHRAPPRARPATLFKYDGSGRRVREQGDDLDRAYRWDAHGRLVAVGDTQRRRRRARRARRRRRRRADVGHGRPARAAGVDGRSAP